MLLHPSAWVSWFVFVGFPKRNKMATMEITNKGKPLRTDMTLYFNLQASEWTFEMYVTDTPS